MVAAVFTPAPDIFKYFKIVRLKKLNAESRTTSVTDLVEVFKVEVEVSCSVFEPVFQMLCFIMEFFLIESLNT